MNVRVNPLAAGLKPPAGVGDGRNRVERTVPSTVPPSSLRKKNVCQDISPGICPTVSIFCSGPTDALMSQQ